MARRIYDSLPMFHDPFPFVSFLRLRGGSLTWWSGRGVWTGFSVVTLISLSGV